LLPGAPAGRARVGPPAGAAVPGLMPAPQAVLTTSRITLVPLADEHLEYEVELDADPEVMRYLGNGRPRLREEVVRLHASRIAVGSLVPGLGFWSGFVAGDFVGWWL